MIKITREEVDLFRRLAPDIHIAIVNRGHPYKKYYVEESNAARATLRYIRTGDNSAFQERR